jgi:hypothetical protein
MSKIRATMLRLGAAALLVLAASPVATAAHAQDPDPTATTAPAAGDGTTSTPVPKEGWGVAPTGPDGPGGRSAFAYNVSPGQVLRDSVSISNLSDEPLELDLYARDAYNTSEDGAFALQALEEKATDAGAWIHLKVDEYTVAPGKRVDIPFEVTVPADATPGDHTAGIIAANQNAMPSADASGAKVDVLQRIAARVYLRVDGKVQPELRITRMRIGSTTPLVPWVQGRTTITYDVENVGNVRITAAAELKVAGLFGRTVHRFDAEDLPELLPGGKVSITRSFDGVPPIERLHAKVKLTAIDGSTTESGETTTFAWAWATPIVLLLAAAAVGWFRFRRHRAGPAADDERDDDGPDGSDDDGTDEDDDDVFDRSADDVEVTVGGAS